MPKHTPPLFFDSQDHKHQPAQSSIHIPLLTDDSKPYQPLQSTPLLDIMITASDEKDQKSYEKDQKQERHAISPKPSLFQQIGQYFQRPKPIIKVELYDLLKLEKAGLSFKNSPSAPYRNPNHPESLSFHNLSLERQENKITHMLAQNTKPKRCASTWIDDFPIDCVSISALLIFSITLTTILSITAHGDYQAWDHTYNSLNGTSCGDLSRELIKQNLTAPSACWQSDKTQNLPELCQDAADACVQDTTLAIMSGLSIVGFPFLYGAMRIVWDDLSEKYGFKNLSDKCTPSPQNAVYELTTDSLAALHQTTPPHPNETTNSYTRRILRMMNETPDILARNLRESLTSQPTV